MKINNTFLGTGMNVFVPKSFALAFLALVSLVIPCTSQVPELSWENYYPNNSGFDMNTTGMDVDSQGNVYLVGSRFNGSNYDIVLVKYNQYGDESWSITYNGAGNNDDIANVVRIDSNNNPHIAGKTFTNTGNFDMLVLKYTSGGGSPEWVSTYNNPANNIDFVNDLAFDSSNNVIVVGQSNFNGIIRKHSSDNGALLWESVSLVANGFPFLGNSNSFREYKKIIVTSSGDIKVLLEYSDLLNIDNFAGLITYGTADGQNLGSGNWWFGTASEFDVHYPSDMSITNNGTVYVSAKDSNGNCIILSSTDYSGAPFAVIDSEGSINYSPSQLFVDNTNTIFLCGQRDSNPGSEVNNDAFTAKFSPTGEIDWLNTFGGTGDENAIGISAFAGQAFVCVNEDQNSSFGDIQVLRYSSTGVLMSGYPIQYNSVVNNSNQMNEQAIAWKILNTSTFYFAGNSIPVDQSTNQGVFAAKYCSYNGTPTINGVNEICQGESATLVASGGDSYLWTPSTWLSNPNIANPDVIVPENATGTQTYNCLFMDSQGCTQSQSFTIQIDIKPAAPVISSNSSTEICQGQTVVLTSNSTNGIVWQPTGTSGATLTASSIGSYSATVTIDGCTSNASNSIDVIVFNNPIVTILTPANNSFCDFGELVGSVTSGQAPYTFLWSTGEISSSIVVDSNGSYSVNVIDANQCEDDSPEITISIYATPEPPTIQFISNAEVCSPEALIIESFGSGSISWYDDQTILDGISTSILELELVGVYDLFAKQTMDGCTSEASNSLTGLIYPENQSVITPSVGIICEGNELTLSVSQLNSQYSWFPGGELSPNITITLPGSYSVSLIDENGCFASDEIVVTTASAPEIPTITIIDNELNSSSNTGNQWYYNGEIIEGETSSILVPNNNGQYYVVVSNDCGSTPSDIVNIDWVLSSDNIIGDNSDVLIYPTAVDLLLTIDPNGFVVESLYVLNAQFRQIKHFGKIYERENLYLGDLAQGIYFVKIQTAQGRVFLKRFIIQ